MLTFAIKKKRTPSIAPKRHAPTVSPMPHSLHVQQAKIRRILRSPTLQPKLTIGQPNDKYEQEADRVADEVMRMPEPQVQRQVEPEEEEETLQPKPLVSQITPLIKVQRQEEPEEEEETLQAKPLTEEITPLVQRQVEPEEEEIKKQPEEEEEPVQTKLLQSQPEDEEEVQKQPEEEEEAAQAKFIQRQEEGEEVQPQAEEEEESVQSKGSRESSHDMSLSVESGIKSIRGGGQPLSESSRAFFEPRFGADFSGVRVHKDTRAADLSRSINAKAFTLGNDVVFGAGQYAPESSNGKRLMAHELTHVVQQNKATKKTPIRSSLSIIRRRPQAAAKKLSTDQPSEQCQQKSPRVVPVLVKNRHHTIMKAGKQTEETLRVKFDECPVHSGIGSLQVKDQSASLAAKEVTMDTVATLQTQKGGEGSAETATRSKFTREITLEKTRYGDITLKFIVEAVTAPPTGVPLRARPEIEIDISSKLQSKIKTDLLKISIAEWRTELGEIGFEGEVFIEPLEIVKAGKKLEIILLKVGLKARNTNIKDWFGTKFTFQLQFEVKAEKVLTKADRLLFKKLVAQGKQLERGAKYSAKELGRVADKLDETWKAVDKEREFVKWAEEAKAAKLPFVSELIQKKAGRLAARLKELQRRLQGIKARVTGPLSRMKNFVDRATSPYFKRIAQAYMNSIRKRGILAKVIRGLGKIAGITKRIAKKLISPLFHPVVQALLLLYDLAGLIYNLFKGHLTWFWEAQGDPTSIEWEKGKGEGEEKGEEEKGVVELGKLLRTVKFSEMPPDEIEALNKAGCTFDLTDSIARCEHEMIMIKKNKIMIITDIYIGKIKFLPREESTKEDTIRELVELNFPKKDIELVKKGLARVKKGTAAIIYQISGDPRRMGSYLTPIDVFETIPVKKS